MSKHENMRRKLQMIRDSLLDLNKEWFELLDNGDIKEDINELQPVCPGDLANQIHEMASKVKHGESTIEKLLKQKGN